MIFVCLLATLAGLRRWVMHVVCNREVLKVERLPGLTVEVVYVNCDTLAKDEGIYVYAQKTLPYGSWFWSRWRNRWVLLFSYDPDTEIHPIPVVTRRSASVGVVSVQRVGEVFYQRRRWTGLSVT